MNKSDKISRIVLQQNVSINSITLFHSAIKSAKTKTLYDSSLKQFLQYYQITNPNELIEIEVNNLQKMLEAYVLYLRERGLSLGEPPPQQMECIVDLCDWFIPEYPQFLR